MTITTISTKIQLNTDDQSSTITTISTKLLIMFNYLEETGLYKKDHMYPEGRLMDERLEQDQEGKDEERQGKRKREVLLPAASV